VDSRNNPILEIIFPEGDKIRSRKIISRSRARPTQKYPSWKMGRMVQAESPNELNAYRLLDADPCAIAYHEQPLTIRYVLDGNVHIHYPDTLVQWGQSRELWEIKPEKEAADPAFKDRTKLLALALPELGFAYRLVIAEDLAREPRLSNVLTLLKFGRAPANPLARERFRQAVEATGGVRWGAVLDGAFGVTGRNLVCRLTLEGALAVDVEQPLTRETYLTWTTGKHAIAAVRY